MSANEDSVSSVGEFLGRIAKLSAGNRGDVHVIAWYRGHSDRDWELVPEVMRAWYREHPIALEISRLEYWLIENFRREGAHLLPPNADATTVYFLARHHSLPTRLLDWSTNALVALFFATANHPDRDGAVHVFFPRYYGHTRPLNVRNELVTHAIAALCDPATIQGQDAQSEVLPILPDAMTGRMLQQGACFTLHPPDSSGNGGAVLLAEAMRTIHIPANEKKGIQQELRRAGVTWAVLFPDLEHLAIECCARHDLFPGRESRVLWADSRQRAPRG